MVFKKLLRMANAISPKKLFAFVFVGFLPLLSSLYVLSNGSTYQKMITRILTSTLPNATHTTVEYHEMQNAPQETRSSERGSAAPAAKMTLSKLISHTRTTTGPDRQQACIHPIMFEDDPDMMKTVKLQEPPVCNKEEWLYVQNGTVRFSAAAKKKYSNITCDYYPLVRETETKSKFKDPIQNITDGFKMVSDFFKGVCKSGNVTNEILYSGVHHNEDRAKRSVGANPLSEGFEGLSIAILGLDSMSRMSWIRRLKKTRSYFTKTMKAIELEGHNIVGDGTTAVLLPMLTGQFEWELPECRKRKRMTTYMDHFPWLWREFRKAGYLTSWSNANPFSAALNWRMNGFKDQPTDFYARILYLALRKHRTVPECDEGRTVSRVWLDFFRDIFFMYPTQRKFLFHFITDFSHDDNNPISKMDDDIAHILETLHTGNYLNNTLLILMGDHGARFPSYIRASWQGKMEERLPYFGFAFPPWFEEKYPQAIQNLRTNTQRLTTPFDVHETFRDFLHFGGAGEGSIYDRGISLFKKIPLERTCEHADIAPHWCTCLDWQTVSANDSGVQRAVQTFTSVVNNMTSPYRNDCVLLSVSSVDLANKMEPKQDLLRLKGVDQANPDRVVLDEEVKTTMMTLYQLILTMKPSGAQFEVTISHDVASNRFMIDENEISRINMYGDDPACILEKDQSIRAYCYCKEKLKTS